MPSHKRLVIEEEYKSLLSNGRRGNRPLKTPDDIINHFWSNVAVFNITDCWPWTAGRNGVEECHDYGIITWGRRKYSAHRFSYAVRFGVVPSGAEVLHNCDNPICVNPNHLRLGTYLDNVSDRVSRGRSKPRSCHKTSPEIAVAIRSKYVPYKVTYKMLALEFKISTTRVCLILTGKLWPNGSITS